MRAGERPIAILLRLLALGLALALAACATTGKIADGSTGNPAGKTPPAIVLHDISGIPADRFKSFAEILGASAGQRDIGIVEGALQQGAYVLTGNFAASRKAGAVTVAFAFELQDDLGQTVETITGEEAAGPAAGKDAWKQVTPDLLQRIADRLATAMAARLSQMGFATRVSNLAAPPPHIFIAAGPGAEKEVDLETLYGPGAVDPVVTAAVEPVVPEKTGDGAGSPRTEIRAVAVLAVKGLPGAGNGELTAAMRQALKGAGWPVIGKARADALTVQGLVVVGPAAGGAQRVSVRWTVATPKGAVLGEVKQANEVPAGSLDLGLGGNAKAVADAAASGIFDIVKAYR